MSVPIAATPDPDRGARSPRLFFALLPDAAACSGLKSLAQDVAHLTGGRAPRAANLHLTLAFLGRVPVGRVADIEAVGATVAATAEPFRICLDRLGLFRDAGVVWAGPAQIAPGLQRLFETLREALLAAKLPVEHRVFHPHVTLARRPARGLGSAAMAEIAWTVDRMSLMASETLPAGTIYRTVAAWPFPPAADARPA